MFANPFEVMADIALAAAELFAARAEFFVAFEAALLD